MLIHISFTPHNTLMCWDYPDFADGKQSQLNKLPSGHNWAAYESLWCASFLRTKTPYIICIHFLKNFFDSSTSSLQTWKPNSESPNPKLVLSLLTSLCPLTLLSQALTHSVTKASLLLFLVSYMNAGPKMASNLLL